MTEFRYPLSTSTWGVEEVNAMMQVIQTGNFTMGAEVRNFEERFAKTYGTTHAVMANSGSSANLLALGAIRYSSWAERLGSRKEVLVPAVSWSTTYYPVNQMGFRLKFVDIDLETLNFSSDVVAQNIDENTAGILAVNLLGNPCDLSELRKIADANDLFLIEDNCEGMHASLEGKFAGTFGHIGTFSTFYSHHISTMEGGVAVTESEELAQTMQSLRAHGWTRDLPKENFVYGKTGNDFDDAFRFVLPGYNLRPLELEAAIGNQQLSKINGFIENRRANSEIFREVVKPYDSLLVQKETGHSSWFGFSMVLRSEEISRKELIKVLDHHSIQSRPIVAGNFTRNPVMKHLDYTDLVPFTNSDAIHDYGLFIGNHHYRMEAEFDLLDKALRVVFT